MASTLCPQISSVYSYGLVQFGGVDFAYRRGTEYRCLCAQRLGEDIFVYCEAELGIEVHGLEDDRLYNFCEIATFVEGMAAEQMHGQVLAFLDGCTSNVSSRLNLRAKQAEWEREGFRLKHAFDSVPEQNHRP